MSERKSLRLAKIYEDSTQLQKQKKDTKKTVSNTDSKLDSICEELKTKIIYQYDNNHKRIREADILRRTNILEQKNALIVEEFNRYPLKSNTSFNKDRKEHNDYLKDIPSIYSLLSDVSFENVEVSHDGVGYFFSSLIREQEKAKTRNINFFEDSLTYNKKGDISDESVNEKNLYWGNVIPNEYDIIEEPVSTIPKIHEDSKDGIVESSVPEQYELHSIVRRELSASYQQLSKTLQNCYIDYTDETTFQMRNSLALQTMNFNLQATILRAEESLSTVTDITEKFRHQCREKRSNVAFRISSKLHEVDMKQSEFDALYLNAKESFDQRTRMNFISATGKRHINYDDVMQNISEKATREMSTLGNELDVLHKEEMMMIFLKSKEDALCNVMNTWIPKLRRCLDEANYHSKKLQFIMQSTAARLIQRNVRYDNRLMC